MPLYMLDTDICSYVMKRSHPAVLARLRKTAVGEVCISAITKSELAFGVEASPNRGRDEPAFVALLQHLVVLDFPEKAANIYGEIRADLQRRGMMIGGNDLLIAAHARYSELILVTNNMREFGRVHGLRLENWVTNV